jgi:excisionase family DNA binding protein
MHLRPYNEVEFTGRIPADLLRGISLKRKEFDPLAYIENAFLDVPKSPEPTKLIQEEFDVDVPTIGQYLNGGTAPIKADPKKRFRKTEMSAPRPRRSKRPQPTTAIDPTLQAVWESLPKNVEFLAGSFNDENTANYYRGDFKESRQELIKRLLDPELSLEETSRLLGVVPATIRRYTNRGWLNHHRTIGGQRRFRLSDVVKFVELHGRFPEE